MTSARTCQGRSFTLLTEEASEIIQVLTDDTVSDDDGELVVRAQNGDAEAYDCLMLRHQDAIARQLRRYTLQADVLDDLTQTVFTKAYLGLSGYAPQAPFLHWLRTIATNVGYEHWRRECRQGRFVPYHGGEELLVDNRDDDADVHRRYNALLATMNRLKPAERQILLLLYVDGFSIKEAARTMGWNQAAVKMRAYRARKKLRGILEKAGWENGSA